MKKYFLKNQSGQVMLVVILSLGAVMIGANVISGFLINNQIKQATNIVDSAKAIYAADAGIEAGYYSFATGNNVNLTFSNKASSTIKCFDINNNNVACNSASAAFIIGQGYAGKVTRALRLDF